MTKRTLTALLLVLAVAPASAEPDPESAFFERLRELNPPRTVELQPWAPSETAEPESVRAAAAPSAFKGLRLGSRDAGPGGLVRRLQAAVIDRWLTRLNYRGDWAASLERDAPGYYGENTMKAVSLLKVVYGSGRDGTSIDDDTGRLVEAIESGAFWKEGLAPKKSAGGEALYRAARFLGAPYQMGGSGLGSGSLDCGLLTQTALHEGGIAPRGGGLTRLADYQYEDARLGRNGLTLRAEGEAPQPGDLVFFNCPTSQSGIAIGGVTHVGFAVGNSGGDPLVLDARSSGVGINRMMGCVKGYAAVGRAP